MVSFVFGGRRTKYGDANNALQLQEHRLSYHSASVLAKLGMSYSLTGLDL